MRISPAFSLRRTLAYLVVTLVCLALLIVLPPPFNTLLLAGLVGVGLWLAPRGLRLLRFMVLALLIAGALAQIQAYMPEYGASAFVLLIIACLLLAAWRNLEQLDRWVEQSRHLGDRIRQYRIPIGRGLLLVALILSLMAAGAFHLAAPVRDRPDTALMLVLLAAGVSWIGLKLWPHALPQARATAATALPGYTPRMRWTAVALGALLLWICAEISGNALRLSLFAETPYSIQLVLLLGGMALVGLGMGGKPRGLRLNRHEALLLGGTLLLALVLRLIGLDSYIRRFVDEIHSVDAITRLWGLPNTPILTPFGEVTAFPWLYPIAQSAAVSLFGPEMFALRLPSAVFGTLTVLALYALVRTLFDRRTALAAALILATLPAHVHFSRLGINNVADPLFGVLGLALLARALRDGQVSDWVWGGICLGLTQYFYEGGRLLYPPLTLGWLGLTALVGVISGQPPGMPALRARAAWIGKLLRGGLRALAAFLLVAAPVYYAYAGSGSPILPRMNSEMQVDAPTERQTYERFVYPWLMYVTAPDQSWFMNGDQRLVLPALLPLFLLGAALGLASLRRPWALLLALWLALTALGNGLLRDVLWSPRYVVVFPALALLLALGLRTALRCCWPAVRAPRLRRIAVAGALAAVLLAQTGTFLQLQTRWHTLLRDVDDWEDALIRSAELPKDTEVYIILPGVIWNYNLFAMQTFFDLPRHIYALFPEQFTEADGAYLAQRAAQHEFAFFVSPDDEQTLAILHKYLFLLPPTFSPYNVPPQYQMGLYRAPRFRRGG